MRRWVLSTKKVLLLLSAIYFLSLYSYSIEVIPIQRWYSKKAGIHSFDLSAESNSRLITNGYEKETAPPDLYDSPFFYLYKSPLTGTIPVYEVYSSIIDQKRLVTDKDELNDFLSSGCVTYKIIGYIYKNKVEGATEIFYITNPQNGDVIYTTSKLEKDYYIKFKGWTQNKSLGYTQSFSSIGTGILSSNVIKLTEDELRCLKVNFVRPNLLIFENADSKIKSIRPGNILYAEKSSVFPFGILNKVVCIDDSNGMRAIQIEKANIEDAFEELHLYVDDRPLIFDKSIIDRFARGKIDYFLRTEKKFPKNKKNVGNQYYADNKSLEVEYIRYRDLLNNLNNQSTTYQGFINYYGSTGNVVVFEKENFELSSNLSIDIKITLNANISFIFDFDRHKGTLETMFSLNPEEEVLINLITSGQISSGEEIKLISLPIPLSGFGIPINPTISLFAGYEANASIISKLGIIQKGEIDYGFDYNRTLPGSFYSWCKPYISFDSGMSNPSINASVMVYLKPQLEINIGLPDLIGESLGIGIYGNLKTYLQARDEYNNIGIYAGLTPAVGFGINFPIYELGLQHKKTFDSIEKYIWGTQSELDIIDLKINDGSPITTNKIITINTKCNKCPLYIMISENKDFSSSIWQPYSENVQYTLSGKNGFKTIYIKVKNETHESPVKSATIKLSQLSDYAPTLWTNTSSGIQGTTFLFKGSNFTPGYTVEFHVKQPDNMELPPLILTNDIDDSGNLQYSYMISCGSRIGTYGFWAIDSYTGKKSNELSLEIKQNPDCNILRIDSIIPNHATRGQDISFLLNGTGFNENFIAKLIDEKGIEYDILQTEYLSSESIKISTFLPPGAAATLCVKIINPDGKQASINFTGLADPLAKPNITTVKPNPVIGSNSPQDFTILGYDFSPGASVTLRDLRTGEVFPNRSVVFFSSNTIIIKPIFTTISSEWTVEVINPGGISSGEFQFQVVSPSSAVQVTGIYPNPIKGSNTLQTVRIYGNGFVSGSKVIWKDNFGDTYSGRAPTAVSGNQVTISAIFGTDPGNWTVQVVNPDGAKSNEYSFSVYAPLPVIDTLSQSSATAGSTSFTLKVNGSTFHRGSIVRWNGSDRNTSPVLDSANKTIGLNATISSSDIAMPGTASITVFSPGPGGGLSQPKSFSITSTAKSDLIIQGFTVSPTSGAPGSSATVSFTIKNQGSGVANASTTNIRINTSSADVTTSDYLLATINVPSVPAGGTYSVNQPVTIPSNRPSGANYIWVILDVNSTANQSNETNDKAYVVFTVTSTAKSDLIIQGFTVSPTSGAPGSSATVSFTIKNQGSGVANASTTNIRINTSSADVTTSDYLLDTINVPSVPAGGTYSVNRSVTIPSNRPSGANYIWVILDVNSTANQSNETNDKAYVVFTVTSNVLKFTSLTPSIITTNTAPYDATLSASGSNFLNLSEVTFSWSGANSGSVSWYRGDTNWNTKVTVNSDRSMTIGPRVVETNPTWTGTCYWTVILRDNVGVKASNIIMV